MREVIPNTQESKAARNTTDAGMVRVSVEPDGVAEELKEYAHWLVWKAVPKDDSRLDKVPHSARTGGLASHSDSRTWASFDEAIAAYIRDGWDGIGFVFSSGDPFTGIDLDSVRNPVTGELSGWAKGVIDTFGGYVEVSPSGEGVHIYIKGELTSKEGKKGDGIEVYSMRRFFTVTGVRP